VPLALPHQDEGKKIVTAHPARKGRGGKIDSPDPAHTGGKLVPLTQPATREEMSCRPRSRNGRPIPPFLQEKLSEDAALAGSDSDYGRVGSSKQVSCLGPFRRIIPLSDPHASAASEFFSKRKRDRSPRDGGLFIRIAGEGVASHALTPPHPALPHQGGGKKLVPLALPHQDEGKKIVTAHPARKGRGGELPAGLPVPSVSAASEFFSKRKRDRSPRDGGQNKRTA
jgi:hypothetical protein